MIKTLPCPWCDHEETVSEDDPDSAQGEIIVHASWYHNELDWRSVLAAVREELRKRGHEL